MKQEEIMVSICCLVYNHEKYIQKCLDGFLMQKTDFKFEVLIHDDASTDRSQEIIREYEKKYPDIIKPIYQKENQYSKGIKVSYEYQFPRAKGKYVAMCEGDDYWCNPNKLQRQVDIMEENADITICGHQVRCISEDGKQLKRLCTEEIKTTCALSSREAMRQLVHMYDGPFFQTSSFLMRDTLINEINNNMPSFMKNCKVGDYPMLLLGIAHGNIYYLDEEMSCYRLDSVESFTKKMNKNIEIRYDVIKKNIETYQLYNEYTKLQFADLINERICKYELHLYQGQRNYKQLSKKKFSKYLTKKYILYCKIMSVCPVFGWVEKLYIKLHFRD